MAWHAVMLEEDLWEGELVGVEVAGKKLILLNVGGEVRAFEDRCPHLGSPLSDGDLDGCTLTCAMHLWEFDALTGKGINPGNSQLTTIETRIVDGNIEVLLPES
ncbi:Rieske (2Fe-2S) protein [Carbonactinospora thermoautotrophica]|uniref:Rieske (2Fe-2S) protein n=1 Tax=Carbonactinospora thermoautotrophica TaxID=1469144 RepID=UPI00226E7476|nr:Rieske 2Fe-2S domain-containing protein [Carbonactinospora thermoautotrophica]